MGFIRRASITKPEGEVGKTWPGVVIGFFVAFGGVLFGFVCALNLQYTQGVHSDGVQI